MDTPTKLPFPYVRLASPGRWVIEEPVLRVPAVLQNLPAGVTVEAEPLCLCFDGKDLALAGTLAALLRSRGVYFSGGPGWSPAEVAIGLRDSGHLTGLVPEVYWTGPGRWHTRER